MRKTFYNLSTNAFGKDIRLALVSDLHSSSPTKVIESLKKIAPDYILLAGDILEALDGKLDELNRGAFGIFKECASIAPTFYCTGNHEDGSVNSHLKKSKTYRLERERFYTEENERKIRESGVTFLLDSHIIFDGIAFGGVCSGLIHKSGVPNVEFLKKFSVLEQPKILICHHPEYYEKYIKDLPIELIVSGHAHGGQWRLFGRGVYAPGQGIFPKYTSGVYDGRLVVSRGLKPSWPIPRIFNPREIIVIDIRREEQI